MGSEKRMEVLGQHELEQRLKGKLKELGELGDTSKSNQGVMKKKRPKIQRVPPYLVGMGFEEYFTPKLISFGIFHHRLHSDTSVGEEYKFIWTAMYLKDTDQRYQDIYDKIKSHFPELKDSFKIDDNASYDPQNIVSIFMLDGCSILHVLDKSDNYGDSEQKLKVSVDQLARVHQDMLLLENQIPFQVLKIICNDDEKLDKCLQNFLKVHGVTRKGQEDLISNTRTSRRLDKVLLVIRKLQQTLKVLRRPFLLSFLKGHGVTRKRPEDPISNTITGGQVSMDHVTVQIEEEKGDPVHLLDYLHTTMLVKEIISQRQWEIIRNERPLHLKKYRIGSIRDLKEAHIEVEKHPDDNNSFHPRFDDGNLLLQLPQLTVDGSTALILLNLAAYEMCPDFSNDFQISSYVVFLSSLIDQPEDVKVLRSAGILINELSSDKEVADLFNRMDALLVPETARYAHIRDQICYHFESKREHIKLLKWMAAYNRFVSSREGLVVSISCYALILTVIQTWLAFNPKK